MGETCNIDGSKRYIYICTYFYWLNLKRTDGFDDLRINGKIVSSCCDGSEWIKLAFDSVHWRAFVNKTMNFWVPYIYQIF
jgi:hypothetical protein